MANLSKTLTGLMALVSAACVPRAEQRQEQIEPETFYQAPPQVKVHQDYGLGWDKEVALYNLKQILGNPSLCNKGGSADEQEFECNYCPTTECTPPLSMRCSWENVISVERMGGCVRISCSDSEHPLIICPIDSQRTAAFEEALRIYLRERKE